MKKIKITIFAPDPENNLSNGITYVPEIDDNGSIIDALSSIDKKIFNQPERSFFPLYKGLIYSFLQLIWDAEEDNIYEDCGVNAYGPNREYMPLRSDINFNLLPNSEITIIVHAD